MNKELYLYSYTLQWWHLARLVLLHVNYTVLEYVKVSITGSRIEMNVLSIFMITI